jgi:hypothetical protein
MTSSITAPRIALACDEDPEGYPIDDRGTGRRTFSCINSAPCGRHSIGWATRCGTVSACPWWAARCIDYSLQVAQRTSALIIIRHDRCPTFNYFGAHRIDEQILGNLIRTKTPLSFRHPFCQQSVAMQLCRNSSRAIQFLVAFVVISAAYAGFGLSCAKNP